MVISLSDIIYMVKKGDTPLRIVNKYGITLNAFHTINPQIEKGEYLVPGQLVHIPQNIIRGYVVKKGDILRNVASMFNLTVSQLVIANPQLSRSNKLSVGHVINIPRAKNSAIVKTEQEYSYMDIVIDLKALKVKYPFLYIEKIGKSVMGKSIYAIRLGVGDKRVFYSADWHANEYLTGALLMKFIEDYAKALSMDKTLMGYDIKYLYYNTTIWLVPMVNPDGVELGLEGITPDNPYYEEVLAINNYSRDFRQWTANIRGVDLNHQWPAEWEAEANKSPQISSPRKYGGPKPLNEPEAIAIYNFTLKHNFAKVLAFHSQGQEIFWGFNNLEPKESARIVNRFAVLSGYTPKKGADSSAGYKDWFIQEFKRPGFTIEVGSGFNPLPIHQFPKIYRENLPLMLEAPLV